jgi:N-acetylmuramoyl-L-alanine amidase
MGTKRGKRLFSIVAVSAAFACGSASTSEPVRTAGAKPLLVVLDAGHGGDDLGAHSRQGYAEKDLALVLAKLVGKSLVSLAKRRGVNVVVRYTRDADVFVSLADRVELANGMDADLFVSLHGNHSPSSRVRGFEVYYASDRGTDAAAEALARKENGSAPVLASASPVDAMLADLRKSKHLQDSAAFAEAIYRVVAVRMRGQKKRGVRQGPFKVLSGTEMPSVLIEVGYLSHEEESAQLDDAAYRSRLADAIARGILEFALPRYRDDADPNSPTGRPPAR